MTLYQNIHSLPLKIFIDCLVDGDLTKLIISSKGPIGPEQEHILKAHWYDLQGEYNDIMASIEHNTYLSLQRDISILEADIFFLESLLGTNENHGILWRIKIPKFCEEINEILDISFDFDYTNKAMYYKDLTKCMARMGSLQLKRLVKKEQLRAILGPEDANKEKITREHFIKILVGLFPNTVIDDRITVAEFCVRIKLHNQAAKG